MPKSRKRKPKRNRAQQRPSRPRRAGGTDVPAKYDELRPWINVMAAADGAEAQGDATVALQLMQLKPLGPDGKPFWRPWRVRALTQLVRWQPMLPKWAVSRWICAQALQELSESNRPRTQRALDLALMVRGGVAPPGVDRIDQRAKLLDRDWVFRQAFLYELGGLAGFLRGAEPALVDRADSQISEWPNATMGAYQLLGRKSATVTWRDVATREEFTVPNNGCGVLIVPGEHAIGRRVPIEGGSMFETAPLAVPRHVAERVAAEEHDWVEALTEGVAHPRRDAPPIRTGGHEFNLLTDVPQGIWKYAVLGDEKVLTKEAATAEPTAREVLDLARVILAVPLFGPEDVDPWSCLAAAVLEPDVADAVQEIATPTDAAVLRTLSERLAEPAASVCRALAERSDEAA